MVTSSINSAPAFGAQLRPSSKSNSREPATETERMLQNRNRAEAATERERPTDHWTAPMSLRIPNSMLKDKHRISI
jgi:hypothetical protein